MTTQLNLTIQAKPTSRFTLSSATAAGCSTRAQSMAAAAAWQAASQDAAVPPGSWTAQEISMPAVDSNM